MIIAYPNTRLAPTGKTLAEVDKLADGSKGVVVGALGSSGRTKHVAEESGVARLLVSHEFDVGAVLGGKTGIKEVLGRKDGETVVEEIKLDPLLVETKLDGLVVKVGLDHVTGQGTVGAKTTGGGVRSGLLLGQLSVGVVVGGGRVKRKSSNRGAGRAALRSTSGGG